MFDENGYWYHPKKGTWIKVSDLLIFNKDVKS